VGSLSALGSTAVLCAGHCTVAAGTHLLLLLHTLVGLHPEGCAGHPGRGSPERGRMPLQQRLWLE
jgi:hypothetical protein